MPSKTSVDIDHALLEQARHLLGTSSIKETIHCALREIVRAEAWRQEVEALVRMDGHSALRTRRSLKNAGRT